MHAVTAKKEVARKKGHKLAKDEVVTMASEALEDLRNKNVQGLLSSEEVARMGW